MMPASLDGFRIGLRQPVDPRFYPYYQRILNGDLAGVRDYYNTRVLEDSFYELLGRLVPLQFLAAAQQIISEVRLRGDEFDPGRGGALILPDRVIYQHWYELLKELCKVARQFIRDKYRANSSATREELWNEYCDGHFFPPPKISKEQSGLEALEDLKAWGETLYAKCGQTPHRRDTALYDLVERFSLHHLVPKQVFFDLGESNRRADARAERDKRFRHRRFIGNSSSIARQYACAMVGMSPSSVSHKT